MPKLWLKPKRVSSRKIKALKEAGANTASTFTEFVGLIDKIPNTSNNSFVLPNTDNLIKREKATFASSIARETENTLYLLEEDQLSFTQNHSFSYIVTSLLLGKKIKSKDLEEFVDLVMKLLVDNGPSVSGAVNTIIAARAGKDMVSALCAGLLTIGKRFGGAVNSAAKKLDPRS